MAPPRKPCDGSANDYKRHQRRGEPACATSKKAYATAHRRYERTGVWYGALPYHPSDEIAVPVIAPFGSPESAALGKAAVEENRARRTRKRD